MSAALRAEAANLRRRYARQFGIPVDRVEIIYTSDGDAIVRYPHPSLSFPEWSTGVMDPPPEKAKP